jgi:transitional endoplasmic reticulum ATPase
MLLDWMGQRDRASFIVGATNFIEQMDPAFVRPGRIDEVVLILPPDEVAREEILNIHANKVRKVPLDKDVELKAIAKETFGWTGAELEKLVLDSARLAMEEDTKTVTAGHFESAMSKVEINMQERNKNIQAQVAAMKAMDNVNKAFLDDALKEFESKETDKSRAASMIRNL